MDVDSTDWTRLNAPFLASIEDTLRCDICKEIYKAPVITNCCHTFCSLCIRRLLQIGSSCPICRANVQGSTLRKNQALEDTVEQWINHREALLETLGANKRQTTEIIESKVDSPEKEIRRSKRQRPEIDYEVNDDIIEIISPPQTDPEYSECPVCGKYLKVKEIESSHIAACLAKQNTASKNSESGVKFTSGVESASGVKPAFIWTKNSEEMKRKLPVANYSLMKPTEIKRVLKQAGLSITGTKQELQDRHREWITIWNANTDLKKPESKEKLRQKLKNWEKTAKSNVINSHGDDIKGINSEQWNIQHKGEFAELIAVARKNVRRSGGGGTDGGTED